MRSVLATIACVLLLSSCIRDNRDNCPPEQNVRILMKADVDADTRAANPDRYMINSVQCYVFDGEGYFVTGWEGGVYTFGEDYWIPLTLESSDDYRFVIWTNQHEDHYACSHDLEQMAIDRPHIDELEVYLDPDAACYESREIHTDIADLHHGAETAAINVTKDNLVTIVIAPNTYKVNFTVEGMSPDELDYIFTVDACELRHDFHNATSPHIEGDEHEKFKYVRSCDFSTIADETLRTSMIVLSLGDEDCDPQFALTRTDGETVEPLFAGDLVELIRESYKSYHDGQEPDFTTTYEFTVPLKFDAKLGVTLDLGNWQYKPNPIPLN